MTSIFSLEKYKIKCKSLLIQSNDNIIIIMGQKEIHLLSIVSKEDSIFEYTIRRMTKNDVDDPYETLVYNKTYFNCKRINAHNVMIYVKYD